MKNIKYFLRKLKNFQCLLKDKILRLSFRDRKRACSERMETEAAGELGAAHPSRKASSQLCPGCHLGLWLDAEPLQPPCAATRGPCRLLSARASHRVCAFLRSEPWALRAAPGPARAVPAAACSAGDTGTLVPPDGRQQLRLLCTARLLSSARFPCTYNTWDCYSSAPLSAPGNDVFCRFVNGVVPRSDLI